MNPPEEYLQQPTESADIDIFTFGKLLFLHALPVFLTSFLVVCLALIFPWSGGPVSNVFAPLFYLTVAVSLYGISRGYTELFKRGFKSWGVFVWGAAILISVGVSINVVLFGTVVIDSPIAFSAFKLITSPIAFLLLIAGQAFYFLIESIVVSLARSEDMRSMENWYLAMYLFILSINSAAMFAGLLILWQYRLW